MVLNFVSMVRGHYKLTISFKIIIIQAFSLKIRGVVTNPLVVNHPLFVSVYENTLVGRGLSVVTEHKFCSAGVLVSRGKGSEPYLMH